MQRVHNTRRVWHLHIENGPAAHRHVVVRGEHEVPRALPARAELRRHVAVVREVGAQQRAYPSAPAAPSRRAAPYMYICIEGEIRTECSILVAAAARAPRPSRSARRLAPRRAARRPAARLHAHRAHRGADNREPRRADYPPDRLWCESTSAPRALHRELHLRTSSTSSASRTVSASTATSTYIECNLCIDCDIR